MLSALRADSLKTLNYQRFSIATGLDQITVSTAFAVAIAE